MINCFAQFLICLFFSFHYQADIYSDKEDQQMLPFSTIWVNLKCLTSPGLVGLPCRLKGIQEHGCSFIQQLSLCNHSMSSCRSALIQPPCRTIYMNFAYVCYVLHKSFEVWLHFPQVKDSHFSPWSYFMCISIIFSSFWFVIKI